MKRKAKQMILISLILVLILGFFTSWFFMKKKDKDVKGKVLLWHGWGGTELENLNGIIEEFKTDNPKIELETLVVSFDDLRNKFTTASASGGGPDLVIGPNDWIGIMAQSGVIQPIDDYNVDLSNYIDTSINALKYEGEQYGYPISLKCVAMYYNKALVDKPAGTLDELLAHARAGKVAAINTGFYHIFWGIQPFGGKLFDDKGVCILDKGGFADWLDWIAQANKVDNMMMANDYNKMVSLFKEGQAAYYPDGPWALGDLQKQLGDDLAVAPLPAGPKGKSGPLLGVESFMFNSASDENNIKAALIFVQYFCNKENQTRMMENAGMISANKSVDSSNNKHLQGFIRQAETAVPFPNIPEMAAVWTPGDDAYAKALEEVVDGQQAAKDAAATINKANKK
ncbi:MAG: extracellular solute-binding protein [Spirochaetes bacterium]|nr:extracellular solute-binding protein [Spirochaetota bacterium]